MSDGKNLERKENIYAKILNKIIKYFQENAAGITLLSTSTIAVGSVLIRYVTYLIEYGKTLYFNIPRSLIDISGDTVLYDFFVKGIVAVGFMLINLIPYFLWIGRKKTSIKVLLSLAIVLSPNLLLIIAFFLDVFKSIEHSFANICLLLGTGLVCGVVLFFNGFYYGISKYISEQKRNNKKSKKNKNFTFIEKVYRTIIAFAVLFVVESSLFIVFGALTVASQNEFKVVTLDDGICYAVIYENSEKYVITECEIENNNIFFENLDIKREINRTDVEYILHRLNSNKEESQ